jgi:hypothetical protein
VVDSKINNLPTFIEPLEGQVKKLGEIWKYILPVFLDPDDKEIVISSVEYKPPAAGKFIEFYNKPNQDAYF